MTESDPSAMDDAAADALRRATRSTAPRRPTSSSSRTQSPTWTGRDPAPISRAVDDLLAERGWKEDSAIATLMSRWPQIVGSDLAEHVRPTSFAEGVLTLTAESTAWATQVRLLLGDLQRVVNAEVGTGVVTSIRVSGPQAPSWVAGPRRVKGRGPRDTYG